MLYVIFGLPGAGKSYTGRLLEKNFNLYFYDGDAALPEDMKHAINTQQPVSDGMRDRFFATLLKQIKNLRKEYPRLVIAQTYLKEKYRQHVLEAFSDAQFILVEADTLLREKRLLSQHTYPLTLEYVRNMVNVFEKPIIPHKKITNNSNGEDVLNQQLASLLRENKRE